MHLLTVIVVPILFIKDGELLSKGNKLESWIKAQDG